MMAEVIARKARVAMTEERWKTGIISRGELPPILQGVDQRHPVEEIYLQDSHKRCRTKCDTKTLGVGTGNLHPTNMIRGSSGGSTPPNIMGSRKQGRVLKLS